MIYSTTDLPVYDEWAATGHVPEPRERRVYYRRRGAVGLWEDCASGGIGGLPGGRCRKSTLSGKP